MSDDEKHNLMLPDSMIFTSALHGMKAGLRIDSAGLPIMTMNHDGTVEFSPDLTPAEAAKEAWAVLTAIAEQHNIDVRAAIADRDRLQRENDNLRQIERNVQAVREHEHKRANAAETDRDRLAAEVAWLTEALDEMVEAASDRAARYADMDDMDSEASAANLIAKDLSEIRGKAHAARREGEA